MGYILVCPQDRIVSSAKQPLRHRDRLYIDVLHKFGKTLRRSIGINRNGDTVIMMQRKGIRLCHPFFQRNGQISRHQVKEIPVVLLFHAPFHTMLNHDKMSCLIPSGQFKLIHVYGIVYDLYSWKDGIHRQVGIPGPVFMMKFFSCSYCHFLSLLSNFCAIRQHSGVRLLPMTFFST
ncbi:MAG: hypothetical protein IJ037_02935, partial [Clostridia bacterium]|nr:hypothetical protein [Clostridia bacterium]